MWEFIQMHHPLWWGVGAMWLVSNGVSALPTPKDQGSAFYEWFFKFTQPIGAGIPRLLAIFWPEVLKGLTGQEAKPTIPANPPVPASDDTATPKEPVQ
jgi:hypothetical protein